MRHLGKNIYFSFNELAKIIDVTKATVYNHQMGGDPFVPTHSLEPNTNYVLLDDIFEAYPMISIEDIESKLGVKIDG